MTRGYACIASVYKPLGCRIALGFRQFIQLWSRKWKCSLEKERLVTELSVSNTIFQSRILKGQCLHRNLKETMAEIKKLEILVTVHMTTTITKHHLSSSDRLKTSLISKDLVSAQYRIFMRKQLTSLPLKMAAVLNLTSREYLSPGVNWRRLKPKENWGPNKNNTLELSLK